MIFMLILGALIGLSITVLISPFIEPKVTSFYIRIGLVKKPNITVHVKRNEKLEEAHREMNSFYEIKKWKNTYRIYEVGIKNPNEIPLRNIYLRVCFPHLIEWEHTEFTGIQFSVIPFCGQLLIPQRGYVPLNMIPLRRINIQELPGKRYITMLVLISTEKDPIRDNLMHIILSKGNFKIAPGTYSCEYEWKSRTGIRKESFDGHYEVL